jgi:hypothetical protein
MLRKPCRVFAPKPRRSGRLSGAPKQCEESTPSEIPKEKLRWAATGPGRPIVLWFDKRDVARAWTIRTREKENKTSGGMPMRPGLDAIYEALRRAIRDDPRLLERKAEEVSKELVRGGYLHDEPADALVAEVLSDVEAGELPPQPQGPRPAAPDE